MADILIDGVRYEITRIRRMSADCTEYFLLSKDCIQYILTAYEDRKAKLARLEDNKVISSETVESYEIEALDF